MLPPRFFCELRRIYRKQKNLSRQWGAPGIRQGSGHHSISVTVDIYGHLTSGANREAVDRLDDRISNPFGQSNMRQEVRPS